MFAFLDRFQVRISDGFEIGATDLESLELADQGSHLVHYFLPRILLRTEPVDEVERDVARLR